MDRKNKLQLICVAIILIVVLMCIGCAGMKREASQAIPPESPFAKIKVGMGQQQVLDLIGSNNDMEVKTVYGKLYNPFYFGTDIIRTILYYKGQGRLYFGNGRVVKIEYDPTEDGYK